MGSEQDTAWLGYALQEAIRASLTSARDMMKHTTPEVLVAQLPHDLMSLLLAGALKSGKLTPESVLEVAPPPVLAKHLQPSVMWRCLVDTADGANLTAGRGTASKGGRRWLGDILQRALLDGLLSTEDVVRHVPPPEWVKDAPQHVLSEMMATALGRGTFDSRLVLTHLTPMVMAEHLSTPLIWGALVEAAVRVYHLSEPNANAPVVDRGALHNTAKIEPVVVSPPPPLPSAPADPDSESWDSSVIFSDDDMVEEATTMGAVPAAARGGSKKK